MLCSFLPWTGTGNMIPASDKIPGSRNTAASATKNPLDTRFAASAKVQLFHLSTLRRRQSSLIWTLARMEPVKTMVFAQWSLADTCMPALPSVLVIDMNWIAAWTPHQLARLARHWTSTGAYILPAPQKLFNALLISALNWNRQHDSWIWQDSRNRNRSNSSSSNKTIFPTQGPRCLPSSSFFSSPHCEGDTLHWSDLLRRSWYLHVCVCSLFGAGDWCERTPCMNATWIGKTGM